jgi:peptidoglycan/LPS O-acetylase OafA/YrhL
MQRLAVSTRGASSAGIDPGVSSYLDVLRIVAAMTVLFNHYLPSLFGIDPSFIPGHDAVIVFFVMSGYVIAYVSEERDRPLARFAIHRLARLWSVLVPSLVLSLLAAILVGNQAIAIPASAISSPGSFVSASLKSLLFIGESWMGTTAAPYNAPTWSLNYEAWYYVIFAAFTFARRRWRWSLAAVLALLAGPRVILLFPCWLLGVWLFRQRAVLVVRPAAAYALFGACLVLYGAAYYFDLTAQSRHWLSFLTAGESYHLGPSTSVIGDTLLAPIVAASIVALAHMPAMNRLLVRARRVTQIAASRTLSLYLYHMPLLVILYGWLGLGKGGVGGSILCLVLGVGGAVLLGGLTEAQLGMWRSGLKWLYELARRTYLRPT